ncbi:hypothetical protein [Pseudomonas graminis]|uniref:hypothetical protein n=1 Tax=Pseudomonas graminis TaxID=158627 RepID=UPI001FC953A7|nr:hypothetical protein [Pseudomonas graminis]
MHGRESSPLSTDVYVIWFDAKRCASEEDEGETKYLIRHRRRRSSARRLRG